MELNEKQALAQAMRANTPKLALPHVTPQELERYPCSVRPVEVKVPGSTDVTVYLTVPFQVEVGAPLFVNYHGGGFIRGRDARYGLFCRRLACTFRCVVVDVDYALAPDYPFPVAVEQAIASAKWAREQAPSLGCDPDKVVLFGQSAGGNLVANVCMAEADAPAVRPLAAVIAYAPMDFKTDPADKFHPERDMPAERARGYNALYCTPEKTGDWRVSPLFAPPERLAAFPQTLIITAGDDSLAPEGEEFARSLARAGVETTCKRFVGCLHGFFINRTDTWEDGIELIHRYLRNVLQDSAR